MKKFLLTLVSVFVVASASAFSFDWGVTGGMNYTKVDVKNGDFSGLKDGKNQAGWFIGARANVGLIAGVSLNGALVYNQNKLHVEDVEGFGHTETERSFSIPLNLRYNFGIGQTGVFVGTGPQFDFALGSTKWDKALGSAASTFDKNNMATSWNISAGAKVLGKLELTAGYTFALGKIGKALVENVGNQVGVSGIVGGAADIKRNIFQINATYYF
jgi:hypothetical protein